MSTAFHWIESTSWELDFFQLPHRIPWPTDLDPAQANEVPFPMNHLLRAIDAMGPDAGDPWHNFRLAANDLEELGEAIEDSEIVRATELLNEFEKLHSGTAFVLFHRGLLARLEGRDDEALRYLQAAGEQTPHVGPIWDNLGVLHAAAQRRDEAIAAFQKALECNPKDGVALEGLAQLRALVKLLRKPDDPASAMYVDIPTFGKMAVEQLNKIVENPDQLLSYGEQLLKDGVLPQLGFQAVQRAHALRPEDRRTNFALTAALRLGGQLEPARQLIQNFTEKNPQDPEAFFHLAQVCNAQGDQAAETAALDRLLALDPNAQAPLGIRYGLKANEQDEAKEKEIAAFGEAHQSWMALVLASNIARNRGAAGPALIWAEKAHALAPDAEEPLLHLAAALGDSGDAEKIRTLLQPAFASRKYSKRLDWNYAQVLHGIGREDEAVAVLREALQGEAPDDFKSAAQITIDAWTGLLAASGVPLALHGSGFIQGPVLLTLPDGDGGIVLKAGVQVPTAGTFAWKASAPELGIPLQQGQTGGGRVPIPLGTFHVREVAPTGSKPTLDCHLVAQPDGALHFRATQDGRRLPVTWRAPENLAEKAGGILV